MEPPVVVTLKERSRYESKLPDSLDAEVSSIEAMLSVSLMDTLLSS